MDLAHSRRLKTISVIVLAFFTWTFGGVFDIAYAIKNSEQQSANSKQSGKSSQQSAVSGQSSLPKP
ncbi:MAG: hypothetical protein AB1632_13850, partial [Nitrospirota bacterium]